METIFKGVFALEGLFFVVCSVLLVYLVIRRIKLKKKEDFEKRDN